MDVFTNKYHELIKQWKQKDDIAPKHKIYEILWVLTIEKIPILINVIMNTAKIAITIIAPIEVDDIVLTFVTKLFISDTEDSIDFDLSEGLSGFNVALSTERLQSILIFALDRSIITEESL